MSIDRFCTVHSPVDDEEEGVHFVVKISSGGKDWYYAGQAEPTALARLAKRGESKAFSAVFAASRSTFERRAISLWDGQPTDKFRFLVNSDNCRDGGEFVAIE